MLQHLLLQLVVPPLVLLSLPAGGSPKPEGRRPKEGRNPKAEGTEPGSLDMPVSTAAVSEPLGAHSARLQCVRASILPSAFGFRPSFGLRISAFGLRPAASTSSPPSFVVPSSPGSSAWAPCGFGTCPRSAAPRPPTPGPFAARRLAAADGHCVLVADHRPVAQHVAAAARSECFICSAPASAAPSWGSS